MEIYGKIVGIRLSREGISQNGNAYQIHSVAIDGSENLAFEVFGTKEYIEKYGIIEGNEGKFNLKIERSDYNGKYYTRVSMANPRTDFTPLQKSQKPMTEGEALVQATKDTIEAANAAAASTAPASPAVAPADEKKGDLPF